MVSSFGLLITLGLVVSYLLLVVGLKKKKCAIVTIDSLNQSYFYGSICAVFGGHFGYLIVQYNELLVISPLLFFMPWIGGINLPLALLSAALAIFICQKRSLANSLKLTDFIVLSLPIVVVAMQLSGLIELENNRWVTLIWLAAAQFLVWGVTSIASKKYGRLGSATGSFLIVQAVVQITLQFTLLEVAHNDTYIANSAALIHISAEVWLNIFMLVTGIAVLYWGYVNHANSLIAEKI